MLNTYIFPGLFYCSKELHPMMRHERNISVIFGPRWINTNRDRVDNFENQSSFHLGRMIVEAVVCKQQIVIDFVIESFNMLLSKNGAAEASVSLQIPLVPASSSVGVTCSSITSVFVDALIHYSTSKKQSPQCIQAAHILRERLFGNRTILRDTMMFDRLQVSYPPCSTVLSCSYHYSHNQSRSLPDNPSNPVAVTRRCLASSRYRAVSPVTSRLFSYEATWLQM